MPGVRRLLQGARELPLRWAGGDVAMLSKRGWTLAGSVAAVALGVTACIFDTGGSYQGGGRRGDGLDPPDNASSSSSGGSSSSSGGSSSSSSGGADAGQDAGSDAPKDAPAG